MPPFACRPRIASLLTASLVPMIMIAIAPCAAQTEAASTPLAERVQAIVAALGVVRAHWGVAVTTMDGTPIFGLNEGQYFRPASNAKLFTTAAAMHLLGPRSTVDTVISIPKRTDADGVEQDDVTLIGGGDANISARRIPYRSPAQIKADGPCVTPCVDPGAFDGLRRMVRDLIAQHHVKAIHGDIVADDSAWPYEPYPSDWSIDDMVWGYGAPVSAVTVTDNQLDLVVAAGAKAGDPAVITLTPALAYYTVVSHVTTAAATDDTAVRIDREPGSKTIRLEGKVAIGKPDREEIAIDDPALYTALALKSLFEAEGVTVSGVARAKHRAAVDAAGFNAEVRVPVPKLAGPREMETSTNYVGGTAKRQSIALAEDVKVTLKVSQNLHAELMLRRLGAAYGTEGSSAQGARVVRQFLLNAGLDGDDFVFYDGSGLSGHDLVTPRATAKLLAYAPTQPWFAQWKAALPVGGEDGSLARRFAKAPLKDHVFAKTGTLGESRALSGYVDCASGKTVIFSIMVDTHTPVNSADGAAMDAIVAAIAETN